MKFQLKLNLVMLATFGFFIAYITSTLDLYFSLVIILLIYNTLWLLYSWLYDYLGGD